MQKLRDQNEKNNSDSYDEIYDIRKGKGVDEFDLRRWNKLLTFYRGSKLIDLGCLDSLVPILAKTSYPNAEVWGIDKAKKAIKELQEKYPHIIYKVEDIYKTKLPPNYFGYAVAGEVLEHLEYPHVFLEETFRILKRGGTLALSTPNEEAIEPGAVDPDRHLWSFSATDLRDLLEPYGEVKIKILRSQYFPVYKYSFPTLIAFCKKR